ncbi:BglG family transcription antiterminator [Pontibacillus salicampi]|uniref:BglG family transcription antiterminator n=1 Tax=Pontibacillus salicampi TaxID=1449801 RepID=A0ABV6LRX2_9BACI
MFVTGRERKMLELLFTKQADLTIKELAKELDVSTRTVHRDIKGIEDILSGFEITVEKSAEGNLYLEGSNASLKQLRLTLNQQQPLDYTPEERQVLIISKLLEARSPIKLIALGNELGVTVATISHDLDKIEASLSEFEISLIRKRGYGVEIEGSESSIRQAISYLIMQNMDEHDFFTLLRQNIQDSPQNLVNSISEQLLELVNKEKLMLIEQQVNHSIQALPYQLADSAYIGLVVHLALAIERIQKEETIQMEENQLSRLQMTKEYSFAEELIQNLSDIFHIAIPDEEIGYTSMHLMGAKARYTLDPLLEDANMSIAFKAKQLISRVSKRLDIDLNQFERLLNDLVLHLKPSVHRLQHNMKIENALANQMKEDFPELFQIVGEELTEVFPQFRFPKEETAFVVMHFASSLLNLEDIEGLRVLVVCSSGVGTAKILAAKLNKQFKEIDSVDHRSLFDLPHIDREDYDLIISTLTLDGDEDYVQVSPILREKDIHKLEHAIRRIQVTSLVRRAPKQEQERLLEEKDMESLKQSIQAGQRYAETASQLLEYVSVERVHASSMEEALSKAITGVKEYGIISNPDKVLGNLVEREAVGGLGVPGTSLALYHTRSEAVSAPAFTIHILETPLPIKDMGGEPMDVETVLLMIAPVSLHKEGLEILSFISSTIVEEEEFTRTLESRNEPKIIQTVSNRIYEFYKTKL